jgi:hypothetical protein
MKGDKVNQIEQILWDVMHQGDMPCTGRRRWCKECYFLSISYFAATCGSSLFHCIYCPKGCVLPTQEQRV